MPLVPLTGLEPVRILLRGIFALLYVAIAACMHRRCSPDFIFAIAVKVLGTRRKVSTRSQKKASLGIVRKVCGVPPNLTRFMRRVSLADAQTISPLRLPVPPQRRNIKFFPHKSVAGLYFAE